MPRRLANLNLKTAQQNGQGKLPLGFFTRYCESGLIAWAGLQDDQAQSIALNTELETLDTEMCDIEAELKAAQALFAALNSALGK